MRTAGACERNNALPASSLLTTGGVGDHAGRCKLQQVNSVYQMIRAHFEPFLSGGSAKAAPNNGSKKQQQQQKTGPAPLTIQMLDGKGGKVR
jgi:hypothetical protein